MGGIRKRVGLGWVVEDNGRNGVGGLREMVVMRWVN